MKEKWEFRLSSGDSCTGEVWEVESGKAEGTLVHILPRSECYVDSHVLGCFMPVTIRSSPENWRLIDPFNDYVEEVLNSAH